MLVHSFLCLTAKDATGAITTYSYDSTIGDLKSVTYPKNSVSGADPVYFYGHDSAGRVTSATDAFGRATLYTYDAVNRVTSVTLPKPTPSSPLNFLTTHTYDQWDASTGTIYTTQTDANSRQTKQYFDQYGQMVRSVDALLNETVFTYTKGLLTSIEDANGNLTSYAYNANRGTLIKTTFPAESSVPQQNREEIYTYWDGGLLRAKRIEINRPSVIFTIHVNRLKEKYYGVLDVNQLCPSGTGKLRTPTTEKRIRRLLIRIIFLRKRGFTITTRITESRRFKDLAQTMISRILLMQQIES